MKRKMHTQKKILATDKDDSDSDEEEKSDKGEKGEKDPAKN